MIAPSWLIPFHSTKESGAIRRKVPTLLIIVGLLVGLASQSTSASAQVFYQAGFSKKLSKVSKDEAIQHALYFDGLVIVQLGHRHLVAYSVDSSMERWRFTSKTSSIRKIHQRSNDLLVEAEQLYSIDPQNGAINWQVQLNCYSEQSCNSRIRKIETSRIYMTGFDGTDDYLMVVDAESGLQQWPVWLKVPTVKWIGTADNLVVVATAAAPYSLLGLDRRTGRIRWRFRPEGAEKPANGLAVSSEGVIAWWPGMAADTVYSLTLDTGTERASWIVSKRARKTGSLRGGGPGYFYAWQPSLMGDEGVLRVWDASTGQTRWRKRLKTMKYPVVSNGKILYWSRPGSRSARLTLHVLDAFSGKELWRYERRTNRIPDMRQEGPILVLAYETKPMAAIVLLMDTGRVLGAGLIPKTLGTDFQLNLSSRYLFATHKNIVQRLEPVMGDALWSMFEDHLTNGEVKEANDLHKEVRSFVDVLPSAARIHRSIVGKKYRSVAAKLKAGNFSGLLFSLQKMVSDEKIVFYEDYRAFILHFRMLMNQRKPPQKLSGNDRKRLIGLMKRLEVLLTRFERKMDTNDDSEANGAVTEIMANLCVILSRSEQSELAYKVLHAMWTSTWLDRTPALEKGIKFVVQKRVQVLLPAYVRSVNKNKGQSVALRSILDIPELSLIVDPIPTKVDISAWDSVEFSDFLKRLRVGVREEK